MSVSSSRAPHLPLLLKCLNGKVVNPALKAFAFAYIYVVAPKIFFKVLKLAKKRELSKGLPAAIATLRNALKPSKFPALAAKLMLQINATEPLIYLFFKRLGYLHKPRRRLFVSTLVAAFLAALMHFPSFQNPGSIHGRQISLDLTLLVATRALDTVVSSALSRAGGSRYASLGDGALFIVSSALIMYSWFYHPERLPPAYRNWITSAASMDDEFISLLRDVKNKKVAYGEKGPGEYLLKDFCERNNQPAEKGSLYLNQPLSCECVHAFLTKNCELHALWRFARGFTFAIKLYGSVNFVMLLLSKDKKNFARKLLRASLNAARSSCFLGTFIALCWYGVCLGRNRILPRLFPKVPRTRWDDTIAAACGCALCGFSCFIDTPQRRKELALFVAPRAVGTVISSEPTPRNLWLERVTFAVSMAILVAFAKKEASSVRGIFGKGLQSVLSLQNFN
ncbi:hypothetical protein PUMCH_001206 [Australozyma saopauloensis]|uniref:Transmembrane protein 135 N-terminal domain-containing protein n=1 Tax=Australozyma saopauloensis TaxID=291208 RepID=A0AAX4H625_9ASCO|nr:hypothetical protein PUMCH_001206 [[Candida] saopauloensis]